MAGVPLLETRDLSMRFDGVTAVDRVSFALDDGELRCVIGPNGAGKSTFFKCLSGQLRPTAGSIVFAGRPIEGAPPHAIARLGIAIKTQVPNLFDGLSVAENLWLAARRHHARPTIRQVVGELLARLGLGDVARRLAGHLPHGQRQWLELGLVLASDPRLMLLDEPTAGMTQQEVARTAGLVRDISRERSVIVVEHDMQFVGMIARKVTVFHQGRILAEDVVEKIMRDERVRDVYLGKQAEARTPGASGR
jgi:branched-chain amino acid transport system ATP-binding protein